MNSNNNENLIESVNTDERLSVLFIIVSFLSILGDEYVKKYVKCRNRKDYISSKKLFIVAISITLFVYLIFIKRNKRNYYKKLCEGNDSFPSLVRLIGGVLLATGAVCLLYFQIADNEITAGPPI